MRRQDVTFATAMERNIDYGQNVFDTFRVQRGPRFIKEPQNVIFDISSRSEQNYATLKCMADGYPTPTFKWYKEEYLGLQVKDIELDPLSDKRFTQTDGIFTIFNPNMDRDRGKYHCTAENQYGKIISRTVELSSGFLGEFNRKRTSDEGKEYWGKSISCDAPVNKHNAGKPRPLNPKN